MRGPSPSRSLVFPASPADAVSSRDPRHVPAAQVLQLLQLIISVPCHHVVDGKRFPEKINHMNKGITKRDTRLTCPGQRTTKKKGGGRWNLKATRTNFSSARSLASIGRGSGAALSTDIRSSSLIWVSSRPTCMSRIPSSPCSCASILACSAIMRGTYDDVDGALRKPRKKRERKENFKIYASDVEGLTWTRTETVYGRSGEDLGVSVIAIPEFPDGQLFDGRKLGLRRYPEARYGSILLSGPYGGGATERICSLHVGRNVGVDLDEKSVTILFPILYTPGGPGTRTVTPLWEDRPDYSTSLLLLQYKSHPISYTSFLSHEHIALRVITSSADSIKEHRRMLTAPGGINSSLS